ncbi:tyrosine-protein phosphatase [Bacillus inaquosorum]|uniref:tyrosine-protein phosphatase n=1 Tax=Bacillus inaquosorum TaxID=483913 RepID=UPI000A11EAAE|nr:tyrosine-protein phosphatase [Bacillus inaquosorum]QJC90396.1 Manganese-dependent protein-tyrosine phosphatase [Bacillus subtilis]QYX43080.1 tyrosine-protein phosphatase [Bacillus inaquosorum]WNW22792.1 tyrosine-protein phosphatase [Bacillus inaquosorum]
MIDIHCHILPAMDDGASDSADSIEMARAAVRQGIRTIIATPHHKNGMYENEPAAVREAADQLNKRLIKEDIPLTVLPGQEIRIYGDLERDLAEQQLLSLNDTKYILIEFPFDQVPRYAEQLFYDLQLKGYIPVIAHPERNREIRENPSLLYHLVEKGAASQMTSGSLAGTFGKQMKAFSLRLAEANLIHFVASDAHNVKTRNVHNQEALYILEKEFGPEFPYLLTENAELLLQNQTIYRQPPQQVKRRKLFGLF